MAKLMTLSMVTLLTCATFSPAHAGMWDKFKEAVKTIDEYTTPCTTDADCANAPAGKTCRKDPTGKTEKQYCTP